MTGRYSAVVFDLDGTLLDTASELQGAVNHAMSAVGCPPRSVQEVRRFAGNGIRKLVERSLPAVQREGEIAARAFAAFCEYYAAHTAERTVPYPGIPSLLSRLREAGLTAAVVSNKAEFAVRTLCDRFFPGVFAAVVGAREGLPHKPDPMPVRIALSRLGILPRRALYVGDSDIDAETAENAGMDCALVSWGFRDRALLEEKHPRFLADDAAQLAAFVLGGGEKEQGGGA